MGFFNENSREKEGVLGTLRSRLGRWEALAVLVICILATAAIYPQIYPRYPLVQQRNIVGIIRVQDLYIEEHWVADRYTDMISQAISNDSVKAVVLVVDCWGGHAHYIEQIYLDLLELKEEKPLVASVVSALSGGYYIAVAADYIYVHNSSLVGSIGAIGFMPPIVIPSEEAIETGAYKWTGRSLLLRFFNLSRDVDNFISAVEEGRGDRLKLSSTQLKRAMIYLGSEAIDEGLADETGSLQKAIKKVAQEANLVRYEVVELRPPEVSTYASLWSASSNVSLNWRNLTVETLSSLHPSPSIHYIYLPPQAITESSHTLESPAAFGTGRGQVLIDLSHGNWISWWDLDILIAELAKRDVTVSFVSQWYDLESRLTDASCLIVASPTEVYTDWECDVIENFVDEGGLLLMFFDPAWEYIGYEGLYQGVIAPINSLSTRFGLSFAKGYLYNEEEHFGIYRNIYVRNFASSPLTQNLKSLVFFTATHIYSMGKEVAWTSQNTYSSMSEKTGSYAAMALAERGSGAVVAFGDITLLSEPYCYVDDNYELILNIISLITEDTPA
jgi:protease-4